MRWKFLTGGLLAGLVLAPAPAQADRETRVRATGAVTVSWQGDPGRGCAEAGVCDVAGSFTTRPERSQGTSHESGSLDAGIDVSFRPPTVRVLRGPATDPVGACTDEVGGYSLRLRREGGRLKLGSTPYASEDALGAGRCAGPLPSDIEPALPSARIPAGALRSGRRLDFGGRRAFTAGPFSAEVVSTLAVRVRRSHVRPEDGEDSGSSFTPERERSPRRIRWTRRTRLQLRFRVVELAGTLTTAFRGADPGCLAFDACDLDGRLELHPRLGEDPITLEVEAGGPFVARRGQVEPALAALRDGRLRFDYGFAEEPLPATLAADVGRPGGARCRDGRDVTLPALVVEGTAAAPRLQFGSRGYGDSEDLLRTRCPGPMRQDLTGEDDVLAGAPFSPADMASERPRVRVVPLPEDGRGAFASTAAEGLDVALERTSARVSVIRVPRR